MPTDFIDVLALPDGLSEPEAAQRVAMRIKDYKRAMQRLEQRLKHEWRRLAAESEESDGRARR